MITIDNRAGSADLLPLFPVGSATLGSLEYGDFFFLGSGPDGLLCPVGVERKAIRDLVNSMGTGRLSGHQLPGLTHSYQWVYLIIEGIWRYHPTTGMLETRAGSGWDPITVGPRRFMSRDVVGYLNTLAIKTGIITLYSSSKRETAQVVYSLHQWWNKPWDDHTSHLLPHKGLKSPSGEVELLKPSLLRRIAAELPGIGWGKSKAIEAHFGCITDMVLAPAKEWAKIPGIGKTIAQRVVDALWEERVRRHEQ